MAKPNRRSNTRSPRAVPGVHGVLAERVQLRADASQADAKAKAPTEFRIFRQGLNASEKINPDTGAAMSFLFDDLSAKLVMDAYAAYGKPLALDYNHGTAYPFPSPEDAKAAGWFTPAVRNGELWATEIDWTPDGAACVASGEYGLFSPWFEHDGAEPARVTRLINCALTNLPALNQIDLLVAANSTGDNDMECASCAALTARLAKMDEECTALRAKLAVFDKDHDEMRAAAALRADVVALTGQANLSAAAGALRALKVQADEVVQLRARVASVETERHDRRFTELLDKGIADLKIAPAERPYWETQCRENGHATEAGVERLNGFLTVATPKVHGAAAGAGGTGGLGSQPNPSALLTASEIEIAKQCGRDPNELAKFKQDRLNAGLPVY